MLIRIIWVSLLCFSAIAHFGNNARVVSGESVPELDLDSGTPALKIYGSAGNKLFFIDPSNQTMSWYAALEFCQSHEMNLATINTADENKIFEGKHPSAPKSFYSVGDHNKYFWLAGTDMSDENNFHWLGSKGHKEFDFKSWAPNKPDGGVKANCVRSSEDGKWSDAGCSRNFQPLCESVDNLNLIGGTHNKQFWVQTSVFETKQLSWNEALEFCHRYDDMRLASFSTQAELDVLSQFFNNNTADAFWISLTDYEVENTYKWMVTGENLTYSNWGLNEPSGGRQMNCVYMYHGGFDNSTAKWFNDNCFRKHRPLCETSNAHEVNSNLAEMKIADAHETREVAESTPHYNASYSTPPTPTTTAAPPDVTESENTGEGQKIFKEEQDVTYTTPSAYTTKLPTAPPHKIEETVAVAPFTDPIKTTNGVFSGLMKNLVRNPLFSLELQ